MSASIRIPHCREWDRWSHLTGAALLLLLVAAHAASAEETLRPLSAADAVRLGLEHSPELRGARADHDAADALIQDARSALFPRIDANVSQSWSRDMGSDPDDSSSLNLSISHPLYDSGLARDGVTTARARAELVRQTGEIVRHRVARDVRTAYYDLALAMKLVAVRERQTELAREHLAGVRVRVDRGVASRTEIPRAEVALAEQAATLERARNVRAGQSAALDEFLGIPPGESAIPSSEFAVAGATASSVDRIIEEALKRRPEMLAARLEEEIGALRVAIARKGRAASLNLDGRVGAGWSDGDEWDESWRIGLSLRLPLYDGQSASSQERAEIARLEAVRARAEALERRIRIEIRTAVLDLASGVQLTGTLARNVEVAGQYLENELERQRRGSNTYLDVLNARTSLAVAESNYYGAQRDAATARARLNWASGVMDENGRLEEGVE